MCCQTVKDHLVSIRPPWSLLAYDRKPGLDILPFLKYAWHGSLFASSARETFWALKSGSFPAVWHDYASWFTRLWDIQHLENRLLCFRHQSPRGQPSCVSLDSLLREAPFEGMREGYLHNHGYYHTGVYTMFFVKKSSGNQPFIAIDYWSLL